MHAGKCLWLALVGAAGMSLAESRIWLDTMNLETMYTCRSWLKPKGQVAEKGKKIKIGNQGFERGVSAFTYSCYTVETGGKALSFEAVVGPVRAIHKPKASAVYKVYADGKLVADSGAIGIGAEPKKIKADLRGAKQVVLEVADGTADPANCFISVNWWDAFFTVEDGAKLIPLATGEPEQYGILTPPASPKPQINGARVFGVRPGSPILFTLPVTGEKPMRLAAKGLPEGVAFDAVSGRLTGSLAACGTYPITFTAENKLGRAERVVKLVVGDKIALTPPMGWNSWNCFASEVSDAKIRLAADAMVKSGLINHGWSYVNIDDYWENKPSATNDPSLQGPDRDAAGRIVPNKRFPDMKGLADYVHGLGLKIGIYSSPGPLTCGKCIASWQHEMQDATSYAEWGFDYLKYDWCYYSQVSSRDTLKDLMRPYLLMGRCLRAQKRDILFSLCQYGWGNVSTWGAKAGGSCWRTTDDIRDSWPSLICNADQQDGLEPFAGPGAWNDPDMLIVGRLGWGQLRPTHLTPNEQYTHLSLWCILCSPLLIGCDMTELDAFTLNLLTNDEVLEVNQDSLGNAAGRVSKSPTADVWVKRMADGSFVAALVNRSYVKGEVIFRFADAGMGGAYRLRDLWRQKDLGEATDSYRAVLPSHATALVRFFPAR